MLAKCRCATTSRRPFDHLREGYDLHLITHRVINAAKSRTISNYWLRPLLPENAVLINPRDAHRLGLADGDAVRVVSATNPPGRMAAGRRPDQADDWPRAAH